MMLIMMMEYEKWRNYHTMMRSMMTMMTKRCHSDALWVEKDDDDDDGDGDGDDGGMTG